MHSLQKFWRLLLAEIKKYFGKTLIIVYIVAIFISVIGSAFYIDSKMDSAPTSDSWRTKLEQEIEQYENHLANPGISMSDSTRKQYEQQIEIYRYYLDNDIRPFSDKSTSNLILYINNLFPLVLILTMIVASKIITDEYSSTTMSNLLTIPMSRWKILTTKFLVVLLTAVLVSAIMLAISIIFGWLYFGFDNFSVPYVSYKNDKLVAMNVVIKGMYQFFYNSLSLIFCSVVAIFLGIIFKNGIVSNIASVGSYVIGIVLSFGFHTVDWIKYLPFPNMDFTYYLKGIMPFDGMTPTFSVIVLLIYLFPLISGSYYLFNTQDIS